MLTFFSFNSATARGWSRGVTHNRPANSVRRRRAYYLQRIVRFALAMTSGAIASETRGDKRFGAHSLSRVAKPSWLRANCGLRTPRGASINPAWQGGAQYQKQQFEVLAEPVRGKVGSNCALQKIFFLLCLLFKRPASLHLALWNAVEAFHPK